MPEESPQPGDISHQDNTTDGSNIDPEDEEALLARGLRKIQIEGEDEEFLMDNEGRIYDLQGNFIGETNEDEGEDAEDEDA